MLTRISSVDEVKQLSRLIRGIRTAMLTTVCADGTLHSRPMATQNAEFDGALWFYTSIDTPKVGEVQDVCQVNVSYADQTEQRYVSISGRAHLVLDREKIIEIWNPSYEAWFHQGLHDPNLALLCVDADKAEYWDSRSNTMMQIVGFSKNS